MSSLETQQNSRQCFDVAVIGGGINGAGIAREAAGRGLKVLLAEQHDLASHTSSASTKLIHGGLRYLETFEFRLVREALRERERLLESAPHIVRPMRFVLPNDPSVRPRWLLRLGLLLYDGLAPRRHLHKSVLVDLGRDSLAPELVAGIGSAFLYSDCFVDDSRLVAITALDAAERGAEIRTRTKVVSATRRVGLWEISLRGDDSRAEAKIYAKALVNAAGPWVTRVLNDQLGFKDAKSVRLVKGSHIVVPSLSASNHAFIFQNEDKRVVFAIPYEGCFTLIGTTDVPFEGDPSEVKASSEEIDYLCSSIRRYFRKPVFPSEVVWTYSGVRPLYDDGTADPSTVTRDYVFDHEASKGEPPVLSIFGGKLTTFRRLAEHALDRLRPYFPTIGSEWTAKAKLPGGDIENANFDAFTSAVRAQWPFLSPNLALRLSHAYGTRVERILGQARSMADLGRDFGCGLTEAELNYLRHHEWARTAEDVLWRRSKLGLHLSSCEAEAVAVHYGKRNAA